MYCSKGTLLKLLIYFSQEQTKLSIGFDSMEKNYPTWYGHVSKTLKKTAPLHSLTGV